MVFFLLFSTTVLASTCKILALGGASDKGAYLSGAISGLASALPTGEA